MIDFFPAIPQPFPGPPMQPTAWQCDGCGLATIALHVHRRPNGDEHWLCTRCQPRAFGAVPVDVVEQVKREREVHAGGPREVCR